MRTQELHRLREERARHLNQLEEFANTRNLLEKMTAKVEDLQAQLKRKTELERWLNSFTLLTNGLKRQWKKEKVFSLPFFLWSDNFHSRNPNWNPAWKRTPGKRIAYQCRWSLCNGVSGTKWICPRPVSWHLLLTRKDQSPFLRPCKPKTIVGTTLVSGNRIVFWKRLRKWSSGAGPLHS